MKDGRKNILCRAALGTLRAGFLGLKSLKLEGKIGSITGGTGGIGAVTPPRRWHRARLASPPYLTSRAAVGAAITLRRSSIMKRSSRRAFIKSASAVFAGGTLLNSHLLGAASASDAAPGPAGPLAVAIDASRVGEPISKY